MYQPVQLHGHHHPRQENYFHGHTMLRAVQHEHDEFYSPEHVFMLWLSSGNTSYDRENLTLRRMMALFRCGRCGVRSISLTSDDKLCLLTNEVLCDRILSK